MDYYTRDDYEIDRKKDSGKKKREKRSATGPGKTSVLLLFVLAVAAVLAVTAFSIAGKNHKRGSGTAAPTPTAAPTQSVVQKGNKNIVAILESLDTTTKTMQIYSIDDSLSLTLSCYGATDIRDKYNGLIVLGQLEVGDILEISYDSTENRAATVAVSDEAWEYTKQSGLAINNNRAILAVGTRNYAYSDALHFFQDDLPIELSSLSKQDVFTMRGIGTEVYVILVTRGHGYLSFKEDADYLGGSLFLNQDFKAQITEGMQLEVPEGSYNVYLENADLTATLTAVVYRNQTTVLDLTEYARVPDPKGMVTFQIQPGGSNLYIDGDSVFYGSAVELAYGVYSIRVESGGYVAYEGTLNVNSAAMNVAITLVENASEETKESVDTDETDSTGDTDETDEDDDTSETDNDNTSEDNTDDGSYEVDEEHYIIIYSDDEVEIYLDGDYMGVTEDGQAVIEKFIGSFTLELLKGEETKSYIIQVDDDGEDFVFRRYFD